MFNWPSIVGEQAALAVKTFTTDGNTSDSFEPEESREQLTADLSGSRRINIVRKKVSSTVTFRQRVQRVGSRGRAAELVNLERSLIGWKRDEMTTVWWEFPQEACRFLNVDNGIVWKDVCEEHSSRGYCITATTPSSIQFASQQPLYDILRWDPARNNMIRLIAQRHALSQTHFSRKQPAN